MATPFPFVAGAVLTAAQLNSIGEAYTAYTPTITATTGTFTTVSATGYYTRVNKIVIGYARITISNNGTAAGAIIATLPVTSKTNYQAGQSLGFGREGAINGNALVVDWNSATAVNITTYNNQYPGGNGYSIGINFTYEAA
jgi:uncharacterized protein (DUF697 family)